MRSLLQSDLIYNIVINFFHWNRTISVQGIFYFAREGKLAWKYLNILALHLPYTKLQNDAVFLCHIPIKKETDYGT